MSERQLVTIRTISSLTPIPGAEFIETATIDGWQTVVKKGEFKPGDSCVYFEVDSFLPASDIRFSFLAKDIRQWNGHTGIRLRTIKLRKQISQGLALPASSFPELANAEDKAAAIGVLKWEPEQPATIAGNVKGNFPYFLVKTDQERIQNMLYMFDNLDAEYEVTIKHDGTSLTCYNYTGKLGVCSRNLELKLDDPENKDNLYIKTATKYGLVDALTKLNLDIAVQGEIVGPSIQKNRGGETDVELRVFDIYDINTRAYLTPAARIEMLDRLSKEGFTGKSATVLHARIRLGDIATNVSQLLAWADTLRYQNNSNAEGAVFKPVNGGKSFKVISNEYQLIHGL